MPDQIKRVLSVLKRWFLLIQEPRVQRILFFFFYAVAIWTGIDALHDSPDRFFQTGGALLVISLGCFFIVAGGLGVVAVLPGIWWLERTALIAFAFGLAIRGVLIFSLGVSSTGAAIFLGELILIAIRFIQIRRADLAPIAR